MPSSTPLNKAKKQGLAPKILLQAFAVSAKSTNFAAILIIQLSQI
jgi:hypothetical protein